MIVQRYPEPFIAPMRAELARLGFADLKADPHLATNNDRVRARAWMMPLLRERMAVYSAAELSALFEKNALPFAPITRPEALLQDPHLLATGGLAPITLPDGRPGQAVLLPITLDGQRPGVRCASTRSSAPMPR